MDPFADKARLERARTLTIEQVGPRQYRVGKHWIDLDGETPCHCEDALLRWPPVPVCKHVMRAMLYEREGK